MTASRLTIVVVGCAAAACAESTPHGFDVMEKSIRELGVALDDGSVTSVDLVDFHLARIDAYDARGPALNAVITVNPNARARAAALDTERAAGTVRGPLHGIPVVVKDNYDTADMPTTAGTLGLATSVPPDDAFQVRRLRDAGAIILAKTNMHELARGITTVASLGGQTRNPYDPARNPGGSSGGTGAAIAASFAAAGMGSDTCGSIRIPSAHHALVGLRGTRGLASGDGIVPLSTTQDIGGPLARSVEDLALVLDATVGFDPADETTRLSDGRIPATYTTALVTDGLAGARLGVMAALVGEGNADRPVREVIEAAVERMRELGAEVIEIDEQEVTPLLAEASVIGQEFKFDLDAYLRETPSAHVRSLDDFIESGLYHGSLERGLQASQDVETLDTDNYRARIAKRDEIRAAAVDLLDEHELDALIYPTIRRTARPIGEPQPGSNCALSALSGLPAITVPGGFAEDAMPVGVELLGRPWTEPRLLELAYAFEQATHHRRPPDFTPSLMSPSAPLEIDTMVTAEAGVSVLASLTVDPSTRLLRYALSVFGLRDADVLSIDLHRRGDDAERGPMIRPVAGRGATRSAGQFRLTGREWRGLGEGRLYLDVHTVEHLRGVVRLDLALPTQ